MLSKKDEYLNVLINKLTNLLDQIAASNANKERRICLQQLNDFFDQRLVAQSIDLLKE